MQNVFEKVPQIDEFLKKKTIKYNVLLIKNNMRKVFTDLVSAVLFSISILSIVHFSSTGYLKLSSEADALSIMYDLVTLSPCLPVLKLTGIPPSIDDDTAACDS